ncbi:hypothetical protein Pr1d_15760 [Bythopirellula goksoeyrii]|uniref:Uncharacterized protein n=1 Tax=Bythopirellula goksoeyrii TaxID=1400387 RepID=A0A5B9QA29_9BACT|nr:hypothetical protein Pr1d_15760 [Bythopirellula goksoeyrii]
MADRSNGKATTLKYAILSALLLPVAMLHLTGLRAQGFQITLLALFSVCRLLREFS